MAIIFNDTLLPVGVKQFLESIQVKDIVFDGVNVWHYDSSKPTLTISSPAINTYFNSPTGYTVSGTVYDKDSGIKSLKLNGVEVTLTNKQYDENGYVQSASFSASVPSSNATLTVTDGANNTYSKTLVTTAERYESISRGSSTPAPGDQTYTEWCRCNICGRQGSAHKWRNTGGNVYDDPDTLFSSCPNGPHYHYKFTYS